MALMHDRNLALTECAAGDEVDIVGFSAETALCGRLREMGLAPGAAVRVARSGSPMIVEVGAARLCLRGADASHVRVRQRQRVFEAMFASADFAAGPDSGLQNPDPA